MISLRCYARRYMVGLHRSKACTIESRLRAILNGSYPLAPCGNDLRAEGRRRSRARLLRAGQERGKNFKLSVTKLRNSGEGLKPERRLS